MCSSFFPGDGKHPEEKFIKLFQRFDKNNDFSISIIELKKCLEAITKKKVSMKQAQACLLLADKDADGVLDFYEFVEIMKKLQSQTRI